MVQIQVQDATETEHTVRKTQNWRSGSDDQAIVFKFSRRKKNIVHCAHIECRFQSSSVKSLRALKILLPSWNLPRELIHPLSDVVARHFARIRKESRLTQDLLRLRLYLGELFWVIRWDTKRLGWVRERVYLVKRNGQLYSMPPVESRAAQFQTATLKISCHSPCFRSFRTDMGLLLALTQGPVSYRSTRENTPELCCELHRRAAAAWLCPCAEREHSLRAGAGR